MNINLYKDFHVISKIKLHSNYQLYKQIDKYISKEWQFIMINDGSFTQNLNSLFINQVNIAMSQKYNKMSKKKLINIRNAWLANNIHNELAFAKSIWIINQNNQSYNKIFNISPIGYALINLEIDIHKHLEEIFFGYCYDLEKKLQYKQIIWGRRYQISYPNKSYITIEEYFTPKLIRAFTFIK